MSQPSPFETIDTKYRSSEGLLSPFPETDLQYQQSWHLMVAIYLFLGGLGAGAYVTGAVAGLIGWTAIAKVGISLGFPLVAVGSMFLMAHLGKPQHSMFVAAKPGTSWISRGVITITLFTIFWAIHFGATVWPGIELGGKLLAAVTALGIVFALGVMAYTGALLSASKGVPVWRTGILPILFMFSALVTGLFVVLLFVGQPPLAPPEATLLAMVAGALIVVEAVIVFFFLHAGYRLPESREAIAVMMKSSKFIYGDMLVGLAVPLALMLAVVAKGGENSYALFIVAGICALIGGFLLRHMVLHIGRKSTMRAMGFEFKSRGYAYHAPKPGFGILPPGNE